MKAGFVAASAALAGTVLAGPHQAHNAFHLRRGDYADSEVCTVYTTVYVTASEYMPIAPNSTVYVVPSPAPETSTPAAEVSTPCPEEESSTAPAYTPVAPSSAPAYTPAPAPSSEKPYVPAPAPSSEKPYVPAPAPSSEKPYVPAPAPSSEKPYVPAPAPSSEKPYVPAAPSSEKPYVPAPAPTSEAPVPSAPAYTPVTPESSKVEKPKPKPSKPASGGGSYGGRIHPNGQKWGITYTPYAENGDCMSASEVQRDIKKIAELGYTTIRSYSTDCGVFENVVPACQEHGLKVIYGVFLDESKAPGSQGANEQLQDIIDNAPKDSVAMVIVGNEYISGHGGDANALASYVKECKQKLVAAGFPDDIPVTTTEVVSAWEEHGSVLCDVIDVFAAQVHPFFDGGISAGEAGDFAKKQLEQAAAVCPEAAAKGKYITEIGWPTGGEANNVAIPGYSEQKEAISSIIEAVGAYACLFSFQNDDWKDPGAFGVEQNFGCADIL